MDIEQARFNMVEQQIRPCEIFDENLLELLFKVKREDFIIDKYKEIAFSDVEIPLPGGSKMLFPRVAVKLIQELNLNSNDKVLEICTGSGYVTALLAKLASFVYSLELNQTNFEFATDNLTRAHINNIIVINKDGSNGLAEKAPFDKIFIGGAFTDIPLTIKQQLKVGGILVGFTQVDNIMHAIKITRKSVKEFVQTSLFETAVPYLDNINTTQFVF